MLNAEDYEIIPINYNCNNKLLNNPIITNKPGSNVYNTSNQIDVINYQQEVYAKYDNTSEIIVKPMYGGLKNYVFSILFKKKTYNIVSKINNEIKVIQKFLNKIKLKSNELIIVDQKNMYFIKKKPKNKIK
jgi:hypothetical protein